MKQSFLLSSLLFLFCLIIIFLYKQISLLEARVTIAPVAMVAPTLINQVNLDADKLFKLINEWRSSQGFKPYIKDVRLCEISNDRVDDQNKYSCVSCLDNYCVQIFSNL